MGSKEQFEIILRGKDVWNDWRALNHGIHIELQDANLSGLDLCGVNLNRANLINANLVETNLSKADLNVVNLSGANLSGADLSGIDLSYALLKKADFRNAFFGNANLRGADLSYARLREADLSDNVDLSNTNLTQADLSWALLLGANLSEARLEMATLTRADLRRANLSKANLIRAQLNLANLSDAILKDADLAEAELRGSDLSRANLNGADLQWAKLDNAILKYAQLESAKLGGADLRETCIKGANLSKADLSDSDLFKADLSDSILTDARLRNCHLVEVNLNGSILTGCEIYGISAWNLKGKPADQSNLIITKEEEPVVSVDNLEVAQFVYLLLSNEKIRDVIDTVAKKSVLILGRFTSERKVVLDAIKRELRNRGYLPILFDFEGPDDRDIGETVSILAHMARFIIADITDAKSIPAELLKIVPPLPSVPVQIIHQEADPGFALIESILRYRSVIKPLHSYKNQGELLTSLEANVIKPAEEMADEFKEELDMLKKELEKMHSGS